MHAKGLLIVPVNKNHDSHNLSRKLGIILLCVQPMNGRVVIDSRKREDSIELFCHF